MVVIKNYVSIEQAGFGIVAREERGMVLGVCEVTPVTIPLASVWIWVRDRGKDMAVATPRTSAL